MNYLKSGTSSSDKTHEAMEMAKPLTPRSERPRATWGSLAVSVQTVEGLCSRTRKCVRKDEHDGKCWPE